MSNFTGHVYRSGDDNLIHADLRLDYTGKYDLATIEFPSDLTEIVSTSSGVISENTISLKHKKLLIQITLKPVDVISVVEIIITYLLNSNVVHYENITLPLNTITPISHQNNNIRSLNLRCDDRDLEAKMGLSVSPWKMHLVLAGDINIRITSRGKEKTYIAFGEKTIQPCHTDIIFSVWPNSNSLVIPKEAIWKNLNLYKSNYLSCYEIIRLDHSIKDLYHKLRISNDISASDIDRKVDQLHNIVDPMGRPMQIKTES